MEEHSEILPRLAAFHDGQLTSQQRLAIQAHLDVCPACRERLLAWQALDRALVQLPVPGLSADELHARTLDALGKTVAKRIEVPRSRVQVRFWVAAAALFLIAFAGTVLWQLNKDSERQVAESPAGGETSQAKPGSLETPGPQIPKPPGTENVAGPGERLADVTPLPAEPQTGGTGQVNPTATAPVGTGDTGIPQESDWPARLTSAEWDALRALRGHLHPRIPKYLAPLEVAEINLLPLFDEAFVPVGYKPLADKLDPGHEAAYSDPVLLTPETAYLVSSLRLEQTSLLARSHGKGPSADLVLKLAEITWQLANLTADRDDVANAIAAQTLAMQQRPDLAAAVESRLVRLRDLDRP